MEVNLLTPTILTSKANNTIQSNNANKMSVYLASGINNEHGALTRVLNSSTSKLTDLINSIAFSANYQSLNISI